MFFLSRFFNSTGVSPGSNALDEKRVKHRAGVSLIIVWAVAAAVYIFFYFSFSTGAFSQAGINKNLLLFQQQQDMLHSANAARQQTGETGAFVFVNINKKFILTHFPSASLMDETVANSIETAKNAAAGKPTPTVIRKIKTSNKRNSNSDFSIKPVPQ